MSLKVIKNGKTKGGERLILAKHDQDKDDLVSVWVLTSNYSLGRMIKSWRYLKMNLTMPEAEKLFNRRNNFKETT